MQEQYCNKKCCHFFLKPYTGPYQYKKHDYDKIKYKIKKAGCFVSSDNKILLVQSRGQFWGPPKGTMKEEETPLNCAIREVKEETGITINENECLENIVIRGRALYYFIKMEETNVLIQEEDAENDANGIGWFNVDCLNELINDTFLINQHCRLLIKHVFGVDIK